MGRARTRPLKNRARLLAVLRLLTPESLPLGQTLSVQALVAAAEGEGVGRVRAGAALSQLFFLGLVARRGDRYSPTSAGAKALATELLARDDKDDPLTKDVPHPGATVQDYRKYIADLLDTADELRDAERAGGGDSDG